MLKIIYVLFLGIILALFVGLGVEAFYPTPAMPDYPAMSSQVTKEGIQTAEDIKKQAEYDVAQKESDAKRATHARNVSIITIVASIFFLALSLTALSKIDIISDGFLLGGLFTLFYSIVMGFSSPESVYRFFVVTIGLIVALVLGYFKFIKPSTVSEK